MPAYSSKTIKEVMLQIGQNKFFLPAIQRKFVWGPDQICKLFDSIMRDYPIGTFLFWEVENGLRNNYVFYQFIQNFNALSNWKNEIAPGPILDTDITGVLDGQQRLNSMYVALQGSYAYHMKGRWKDRAASYPERQFCIDLFFTPEETDQVAYSFAFKTSEEMTPQKVTNEQCWFPVKRVLEAEETDDIDDLWDNFLEDLPSQLEISRDSKRKAKRALNRLYNRLANENLINYFPVQKQNLDEILDIFVRVNSGGKPLSKTDLLFSTIVAHWDDGREKIEAFLEEINKTGDGFYFGTDWIMRTCLILSGFGSKLNVAAFGGQNVATIKDGWQSITQSVKQTVDLLVEWGFDGAKLSSANAVIPIAYVFQKGFDIESSKEGLRLYLIKSLLTGLFGSHSDSTLIDIRNYLDKIRGETTTFDIHRFSEECKLPSGRTIRVTEENLDSIIETEPLGGRTFLVLSLLYPSFRFHQVKFHQDHIHPRKAFYKSSLEKLGLDEEQREEWINRRDTLPNLQLLEGRENQQKSGSPFIQWLEQTYPDSNQRTQFLSKNHISANVSLELADFDIFWTARRDLMKAELARILDVRISPPARETEILEQ